MEKNQSVDIDIRFELFNHGDENFDGPSGTYGHAFYPDSSNFAGDIHFDDSEEWTERGNGGKVGHLYSWFGYRFHVLKLFTGVNFFQIAVHEIGHSLGLGHAKEMDSVMTTYYNGYDENFDLTYLDVERIQVMYSCYSKFICVL